MRPSTSIERRLSLRIPTSLEMQVYAYGMLVANGKTVEMSEHGMSMYIERHLSEEALDPGKYLDVMLRDLNQQVSQCWVPIKVVRRWEAGIAGRFVGEAFAN